MSSLGFPHPRRSGAAPALDPGRVLVGLVVVAVGVIFLLDAAGVLRAGTAFSHWWPVLVIAAGATRLIERRASRTRSWLLVVAGVVLLLLTTHTLGHDSWSYLWPVAVILAGLVIVLPRSRRPRATPGAADDDFARATAIFGAPDLVSSSQRFRGASLTAFFGGVTLDLRSALPAPEGAAITATAAFGGVEILVPRGWEITVRATPIFGGLTDKTDHSVPPPPGAPALRVDAVTVFGGVEIKHQK